MKVLIIYHAGLSEDAKNIFREYALQGVELTVIVPRITDGFNNNESSFRFIFVPFKMGFNLFKLFVAMRLKKPDVIHVFDEYSSIDLFKVILCRNIIYGKRVPIFAYAFQNIPFSSPSFVFESLGKFFKRIIYKVMYPLIFWYAKNNVAGVSGSNSEALLNIKNINPKIPTKLIFWGVDVKKFSAKDKIAYRQKFQISKSVKLLGYFGRMIEEKGLDILVHAIKILYDHQLILVGDGNYKKSLIALGDALGVKDRIFFHESASHSELVDYYNMLDLFVLPSKTMPQWKEQYGRVLVEAMACGLPIIGSSSGAIPDVLKGYPKSFIFQEEDVNDLIKKIKGIKQMDFPSNFILKDFLYKFSVENFVTEHLKFYKNYDSVPHL